MVLTVPWARSYLESLHGHFEIMYKKRGKCLGILSRLIFDKLSILITNPKCKPAYKNLIKAQEVAELRLHVRSFA